MRTTAFKPLPQIKFKDEQEEQLFSDYVSEWRKEVPDLTPPQVRQLHKAGLQYVLAIRLAQSDLANDRHTLNTRYSHLQEESRVLTALGLDRRDTVKPTGKDNLTESEREMREVLLGLGTKVRRQ